jgi:Flp pilus assembly protein TadD
VFEQASFGGQYALGMGYQEAHRDVEAQLNVELQRLSPTARQEVEQNLAMIRGAIGQINAALAYEPGNPLLQELLLQAYREELAMMQRVGGLTQHVMSREDI